MWRIVSGIYGRAKPSAVDTEAILSLPMRLNLNKRALRRRQVLSSAAAAILLVACSGGGTESSTPLIVATTGHIHDALQRLTDGVDVETRVLCGPGVDPHSYGATSKDVIALDRAKAIIYNGFHLEAQLGELLEAPNMAPKAWAMSSAFPQARVLDWLEDGEVDPGAPHDPHIWNHLEGWGACVTELGKHLQGLFPENADVIAGNTATYAAEIADADAWAADRIATLPEHRRVLISGHDAFNYFAKAYGMETHAVLGVGNDPEADIRTMQEVAAICAKRKVPVIFLESITDPKITQSLEENCGALGWQTRIASEPLYSDDLGEDPPVNTFLGAFRTNVDLIVSSLGGKS